MAAAALVVHLASHFGGAGTRTLDLLTHGEGRLALAGLEGSPLLERARAAGLETYAVGRAKFDPRIERRLAQLVRSEHFDVLDAQDAQSTLWATRGSRRRSVGVVSTLHSWYRDEAGDRLRVRGRATIEERTRARIDRFVSVAPPITRSLIAAGTPEERVNTVRPGIVVPSATVACDEADLYREFGIREGAALLVTVARFAESKGLRYLIETLAELDRTASDLNPHLLLLGSGHLGGDVHLWTVRHGVTGRLSLAGSVSRPRVAQLLAAADIFVLPSLEEHVPFALLEAAALARPIVATRVGGVPAVVEHGRHGLLVEPAAPKEMAGAIVELLVNRTTAMELGAAARERVRVRFPMAEFVQTTAAVHDAAAGVSSVRAASGS